MTQELKVLAMKCRICGEDSIKIAQAQVLRKHSVGYFHCQRCGFVQTEVPFWLEEAYENPINIFDSGILTRNIRLAQQVSTVLYFLFDRDARFLDYAGGYGIFTRLMRDIGFDFYWDDPHTKNLVAQGFEYNGDNIEALTTFESFEHFVDPLTEIEKILSLSSNILFTTELVADQPPRPEEWWYYGLEHGQHVSFYSEKTIRYLAEIYGLNYYSAGTNLFLLSKKQINPKLFRLLVRKYQKWGLYRWVTSRMKVRTESDMETLIQLRN